MGTLGVRTCSLVLCVACSAEQSHDVATLNVIPDTARDASVDSVDAVAPPGEAAHDAAAHDAAGIAQSALDSSAVDSPTDSNITRDDSDAASYTIELPRLDSTSHETTSADAPNWDASIPGPGPVTCPLFATTIPTLEDECLPFCGAGGLGATLNTDAEVEALAAEQCGILLGDLTITSGVSSLKPLAHLRGITGSLELRLLGPLLDLRGLEGMTYIGERLRVDRSSQLNSLDGLENLEQVARGIIIEHNTQLTDIGALGSARFAGSLILDDNPALRSLDGLDGMETLVDVRVANHPELRDASALGKLTAARSLNLYETPLLTAVPLKNLTSLEDLTLSTGGITSLDLSNLATASSILVVHNPALTNIDLSELAILDFLEVDSNALLHDLGDLEALMTVGTMRIASNPHLSQCAVDVLAARLGCTFCSENDTSVLCD
jgi:hypothetical protein